jgi:signal transduction histidine kinase
VDRATSKLGRACLVSVVYFLGAELGGALSLPNGSATFWPPNGILLAVLLRSDARAWSWLVAATLPAHLAFDGLHSGELAVGVSYWASCVVQAVVGAWMLQRTIGTPFTLSRVRHVVAFLVLCVLAGATIGATLASAATGHAVPFKVLWMGNAIGVLAVAPLILAWTEPVPEGASRRGLTEWLTFLAVAAIVVGLVVVRQLAPRFPPQAFVVLVVPMLSWAAWRLGPRGTGVGILTIVTVGIKNHRDGVGILALGGAVTLDSMVMVQALASGIVVTFLVVTAAVAEWGALERALRQANQLKREFVSTISHELRTPLAAILGYLEMARDERFGPAQRFAFLDDIDRAARQLLELIEATLDVGRLESGRDDPCLEGISLRAFWESLRSGCATIPRVDGVELRWGDGVPDLVLVTDRRKLAIVLRNLITNALKFTERGWVHVEAGTSDAGTSDAGTSDAAVVFRVRDTGIGIRPEDHARIFEMYRQADGSDTRLYGGTGLGLHIVRRFLEQLGGRVTLESAPGQGSTFTVSVPTIAAGPTAA